MKAEQIDQMHKGKDRDETAAKKNRSGGQKARIETFPRPSFEPCHAPDERYAGNEDREG